MMIMGVKGLNLKVKLIIKLIQGNQFYLIIIITCYLINLFEFNFMLIIINRRLNFIFNCFHQFMNHHYFNYHS
jgi:hypothetical protein